MSAPQYRKSRETALPHPMQGGGRFFFFLFGNVFGNLCFSAPLFTILMIVLFLYTTFLE